MDNSYHLLLAKINNFTSKFYLNKMLRGAIYTSAVMIAAYLLLFLLIYYFTPPPLIKTFLFFAYLLLLVLLLGFLVIRPLLSCLKLRKTLTPEESAVLIGKHFAPIKDKLLNILQLKAQSEVSSPRNELILAGIDQKIQELNPIPFTRAINLSENRKYLKYLFIPLTLVISIAIIAPVVLREGTRSFIAYNKVVLPPSPFQFIVNSAVFHVTQGDDLILDLTLKGDQLPQEVYIREGLNTFKLERKSISNFSYIFKNLQTDKIIYFTAGGFNSKEYPISVRPRPSVLTVEASLVYPAYLKKKKETIRNAGDLRIPDGTQVSWRIYTENTVQLLFDLNGSRSSLRPVKNYTVFNAVLKRNQLYRITPLSLPAVASDSIVHQIDVIADQPPVIKMEETTDSLNTKALYFNGTIADDHGFSSLNFVYTLQGKGVAKKTVSTRIPFNGAEPYNSFFFFWNLSKIDVLPGQRIEYYIEVADNDGVNGPKKVRSLVKNFVPPSDQQIAKQTDIDQAGIKAKMGTAIKFAAEVEKQSKKVAESLLDKKNLTFEDKKEISSLLEKQKKLEEAVHQIKQGQQKDSKSLLENAKMKEDLAEKQKQIDNLFDHILDPKTKALLQKLQQMMDQNNKDQLQNELSKMTIDNKSLKNELDRMLELYKQLEYEQNLQNKIDRLNNLATEQKELSREAKSKAVALEEQKKDQEKYIEEFNSLRKEMEQLSKKNKALERPNNLQPMEKESQQVQKLQQQSLEDLKKNSVDKAIDEQQKAAKALQEMATKLGDDNEQSAEMESNLNADELRRLLQDLLQTSFDQEKVMLAQKKMTVSDPAYLKNVQHQRGIKDNLKTIADSLSSLSKRVPQIQSTVTEEMQQINFNVDKSLENLAERKTAEATRNQQYAMTGVNNLALMLNEALEQLEKNRHNAKKGGKGNGKQSLQQLEKMQAELNKNMLQAKQQMEKDGNKGSSPKGKMSEGFAKMAQQQQLIREALQRLNREDNKDGKNGLGNLNQMVQEMKITENDLLNKKIEEETLLRQKELLTKLLEAKNSSREQDQEEKRQSKAGQDLPPPSYIKKLEEYKKKKITETELMLRTPPSLNDYYRNKVSDYFKSLNLPYK